MHILDTHFVFPIEGTVSSILQFFIFAFNLDLKELLVAESNSESQL